MALDDPEEESPLTLPAPAGAGRLFGLRPADWLAAIGGLMSNLRVGSPQTIAQGGGLRPGLAMFPLAQGLAGSDAFQRQQATVKDLASRYGGQTPDIDAAILAMNQDPKTGMGLLVKALADQRTQAKEARTASRVGKAAEAWGQAQIPVTEPGITSFGPMTQEDLLKPPSTSPVQNFQDVDRPASLREVIGRLTAIPDDETRGLAFKQGEAGLNQRILEESKRRPETKVQQGAFIRYDPLRGTAVQTGRVEPSAAEQAVTKQRLARTAELEALTQKHQRPAPPTPGSQERPVIGRMIGVPDTGGPRQWFETRSYSKPNKDAPGGVEQVTERRPLGLNAPWKPFAPPRPPTQSDYTTTTTRETAPQEITSFDRLKGLNAALPENVAKAVPGFKMPTTPTVTLPDGTRRSKQQVVDYAVDKIKAHYLAMDPPLKVDVRVKPTGEFEIIRALRPGQKLGTTSTRTRGFVPAPAAQQPSDTEDDAEE